MSTIIAVKTIKFILVVLQSMTLTLLAFMLSTLFWFNVSFMQSCYHKRLKQCKRKKQKKETKRKIKTLDKKREWNTEKTNGLQEAYIYNGRAWSESKQRQFILTQKLSV